MKLVLFIAILYFAVDAQAQIKDDDNVQRLLEFLWDVLKKIASMVYVHPDTGLSIGQYLTKYNYPLESHNVTTEDNFTLILHRIPQGRNEEIDEVDANTNKPVVFLVHGFTGSSMDWIVQGPNSSLALLLADLGYDVWLANLRGSSYSDHKTYSRKDSEFWDYSFHERGSYDLPASIDYILTTTGVNTISFVGHSEGTTNGLVLTSTKSEYNQKINLMTLLSPIAYIGNLTSPVLRLLGENESVVKLLMSLLNVHGFPSSSLSNLLVTVFCNDDSSLQDLCISIVDLIAGFDVNGMDKSMFTVFFSTPGGFSIKEGDHYLQESTSGYFRQYDYGSSLANRVHYGSATPPEYDIKKVTVPLALYYARNDFVSSVLDVEKFIYQLTGDTADRFIVEDELFNHLDFLFHKDVKTLLYDRVINVITTHNPVNTN